MKAVLRLLALVGGTPAQLRCSSQGWGGREPASGWGTGCRDDAARGGPAV